MRKWFSVRDSKNAMRDTIRYIILMLFLFFPLKLLPQNNCLIINGGFIKLKNGQHTNPVFIILNQGKTSGIIRKTGHIISEGQYNYVKWKLGEGTGNYVIPFGYETTDYIPFAFNKKSNFPC